MYSHLEGRSRTRYYGNDVSWVTILYHPTIYSTTQLYILCDKFLKTNCLFCREMTYQQVSSSERYSVTLLHCIRNETAPSIEQLSEAWRQTLYCLVIFETQ